MGEKKIEAYEQEFIPGEGWVNIIPEGETTGYEDEFFNVEDTKEKKKDDVGFFERIPFYSGLTDWNFSPERPTEYSAENMDFTDPQDGTLSDDYLKLLYNSVVGGVGYDLPKWLYETNPVEFLELNKAVGAGMDHLGYESAGDWVSEDWPGIGDWAFSGSPFDEDLRDKWWMGGADYDPEAVEKHPYIFGGPDEGLEKWTRLASQLGVPLAGALKAPDAAGKVLRGLQPFFPSIKYWDDLGIMNKQLRQIKNAYNKTKTKWPKITGVWDKFIRPMYQMPTRMVKHAVTPTRWKQGWDKTIDPKGLGRIDPKTLRTAQPERTYSSALGRNWALGTGAKLGIDTLQNKALASLSSYEDPIMRMARKRDPGLEVTLPLQYTQ